MPLCLGNYPWGGGIIYIEIQATDKTRVILSSGFQGDE